jgi:hypothetical protein
MICLFVFVLLADKYFILTKLVLQIADNLCHCIGPSIGRLDGDFRIFLYAPQLFVKKTKKTNDIVLNYSFFRLCLDPIHEDPIALFVVAHPNPSVLSISVTTP